jgi:hypothetical protein
MRQIYALSSLQTLAYDKLVQMGLKEPVGEKNVVEFLYLGI